MTAVEQLRLFDLSTVPTVWDDAWDEDWDDEDAKAVLPGPSPEQLAELSDDALYELDDQVGSVLYELELDEHAGDDATYDPYSKLSDLLQAEIERRVDRRFHCLDCDVHTGDIGQYPYDCPDELWHAVVPNGHGMLCLPCLSKRLAGAGLPWPFRRPAEALAADLLKLGTVGAA